MNTPFRKLCLVLLSAALVALAGCKTKPRPAPTDTAVGSMGDTAAMSAYDSSLAGASAPDLMERPFGALDLSQQGRSLLQPVYFDFDQSAIKPSERAKVQEAVKHLQANPQSRLLLEGHCDWRGTTEYNIGLGDRRANAVKEFIQTLGISTGRLETLSKGDLDAAENSSAEAMAKDRRVDFVVLR